jgi:hypothetical protein
MFQNFLSNSCSLLRSSSHPTNLSFASTEFFYFFSEYHSDLARYCGAAGILVVEFGCPRQSSHSERSFPRVCDPVLHNQVSFVTPFDHIRAARVVFVLVMLGFFEIFGLFSHCVPNVLGGFNLSTTSNQSLFCIDRFISFLLYTSFRPWAILWYRWNLGSRSLPSSAPVISFQTLISTGLRPDSPQSSKFCDSVSSYSCCPCCVCACYAWFL